MLFQCRAVAAALFCRISFSWARISRLAEAVALQLQNGPFQFAPALAAEQIGGQIPIGRRGQRGGDLLAGRLLLLVAELVFQ